MIYSVVIPAMNAATTIEEAIDSVAGQTVPPTSIVVVDDGSTDDTGRRAALADARVRVIAQANHGAGHATTTGLDAVETPFVAFVDADDIWLPDKIERQMARLSAEPPVDGVFAHARQFRMVDGQRRPGTVQPIWGRSTLLVRRDAALRVGPMVDPPGARGEMLDWICQARDLGVELPMMPDILAWRRVHAGSLSYGRDGERDRGYVHVARQALRRRRGLVD